MIVAALAPGAAPATEGITAQPTWSDTGLIFPLTLSGNAPSPEDPRTAAGVIDELTEALTDVALIGLESTHSFMSVVDRVFIPRIDSADTVTDVAFNPGMDAAWIEEFLTEPLREDSVPIIHPQVQETLHACAFPRPAPAPVAKARAPPSIFPASVRDCLCHGVLLTASTARSQLVCPLSRGRCLAIRSAGPRSSHTACKSHSFHSRCLWPTCKTTALSSLSTPSCGRPWSRGARGVPVDPPIERRHR